MKFLVFDTSTATGFAAVLDDGQILSHHSWIREGSHAELLTPAIDECLKDAGLEASNIDCIAVGIGPGSFTGARVSVNAARSFAYALGKPIYPLDTAELLASAVIPNSPEPLLTLIDAQKNQIFFSTFIWQTNCWISQTPLISMLIEDLDDRLKTTHLCVGDGFGRCKDLLSDQLKSLLIRRTGLSDYPTVESFARIDFSKRQSTAWNQVQALYIKASSAEEKLGDRLGKKSP